MNPRLLPVGLAPATLLLACILTEGPALANPVAIRQPAVAGEGRPLTASQVPVVPQVVAPDRHAIAADARRIRPLAASSLDGTWQEFDLLQFSGAVTFRDQTHDQLLALAVYPRAENWALPLTGPIQWQPLPVPPSPTYLDFRTTAVDPSTGLVYLTAYGSPSVEIHTLDPWTGAVAVLPASGTPPLWPQGTLAFDAVNQRLLFLMRSPFPGPLEVWALDLLPAPVWSQWTPSGTPPSSMTYPIGVVDPVRRELLFFDVYGGYPATEIPALTLDAPPAWLHFATNGLPADAHNPTVYDVVSDRMWTIDGQGEPYSLSLATHQWSHVSSIGPGPSPRREAGVAIDPVRHRLLVSGGTAPSEDVRSDTWALSLDAPAAWTELVHDATRPPVRGGASDGYDASRHRMVVFDGSDELGGFRNDTWALDLSSHPTWSPLATQGTTPPGRYWAASAWDDARDQLVVFGGHGGDLNNPLADLWALSFAGATPTWSPITAAGPAPTGRFLSQLVYDSSRDRFLLLFGDHEPQLLGDVWELRLLPTPAWRQLAPTGVPPAARGAQMCVYEPAHDRVLMFGGGNQNGLLNDLWALDLASGDGAWQQLPVAPGPSQRNLGVLRTDMLRNRLLLFGGYGVSYQDEHNTNIEPLNDTWALNLAGAPAWQSLSPAGFPPPARDRANGAYDPIYDRLLIACGAINGSNGLWALDFADAPTPTLLDLASRDVTVDRVRLVWGGADPGTRVTAYRREPGTEWRSLAALTADGEGYVTLEDRDVSPGATLEYRLGLATASGEEFFGATRVEVPLRVLSLSARAIDGRASFTVELPSSDPATLSLFDVAGRSVWSRPVGALGPGSHEVSAGDATLPAALYFARLTQGQASRFTRVLIMR